MKKILFIALCMLITTSLAILTLTGCFGGKAPVSRFYLLNYAPASAHAKANALPYKVRLKDFQIAEAYKRNEIVYRKSAHEIRFYNFHQWAVKPENIVSDMVYKHLQSANLFDGLTRNIADFRPDYILSGEINAMEEYDDKDDWYAHLSITFQIEDTKLQKPVWQKTYDVRKIVKDHEPVSVVAELSSLLQTTVENLIKDIDTDLNKNGKIATDSKGITPLQHGTAENDPSED